MLPTARIPSAGHSIPFVSLHDILSGKSREQGSKDGCLGQPAYVPIVSSIKAMCDLQALLELTRGLS